MSIVVNAHSGVFGTAEMIAAAVVSAAHHYKAPEGVLFAAHRRRIRNRPGAGEASGHPPAWDSPVRAPGAAPSCDLAAARREPIPVFAEMSSVNPFFILPKALAERWGAIAAACISPSPPGGPVLHQAGA